ncbi:MAG TPA: helix-turn-helix transcriptional regulator [Conexibacter sp.]|nr:helix-turn-helix transcriptional regulator [Conexibacter sp.]
MRRQGSLDALAAAVRVIRAREGLSRAEVARRAGLDRKYPGQVERGEANPTHTQLDRLARGLGLRDVAELWRQAVVEAERAR